MLLPGLLGIHKPFTSGGGDTTPPSIFTLSYNNVTTSSVDLTWTASTDNVGVTGYEVYRNGVLVTTVVTLFYTLSGLSAETIYTIYVKAKDAAGNGRDSNSINVTTDTAGRNNLILTADAESGILPAPFDVYSAPLSTSFTKVTTAPKVGSFCYKSTVNKTDPDFAGGQRAELNLYSEITAGNGYDGFERWIGFSMKLDSAMNYENLSPYVTMILCQFHDNEQAGETGFKSAFELHLCNNRLSYTVRSNATENTGNIIEEGASDYITIHMNGSNPIITKNVWWDIVLHVRFSNPAGGSPNSGLVEIWINGILCGTYSGPMGYNHDFSPFFKIGQYCYFWNDYDQASYEGYVIDTTKTTYYDEIRYGNENATYNDVAP